MNDDNDIGSLSRVNMKLLLWVMGALFAVSLAVIGVNFAEIRQLDNTKASIREVDQICQRLDRIQKTLESRFDRLERTMWGGMVP